MTITDLLREGGFTKKCEECPYYGEWMEPHPYGSTFALEPLAECRCDDDLECPRLNKRE